GPPLRHQPVEDSHWRSTMNRTLVTCPPSSSPSEGWSGTFKGRSRGPRRRGASLGSSGDRRRQKKRPSGRSLDRGGGAVARQPRQGTLGLSRRQVPHALRCVVAPIGSGIEEQEIVAPDLELEGAGGARGDGDLVLHPLLPGFG